MALTLGEMVDQTIARLNQFSTNRPAYATFNGFTGTTINLKDVRAARLSDALVELDTEVVFVSEHDSNNSSTTCPAWFRQQLGTPRNDAYAVGSRVTINPVWTRFGVARVLADGINALYPDLFAVKETQLSSSAVNGNYALPDDVDGILHVSIEDFGPGKTQLQIGQWSLDIKNTDSKRYLRTRPAPVAGRPIRVTYRAKPVAPDPAVLSSLWSATGLPDSAADLPGLYAMYTLIPSGDAAKGQSHSVEQSDSNRHVQVGALSSVSRRFEDMFRSRLLDERRKLLDQHPPRIHKTFNG